MKQLSSHEPRANGKMADDEFERSHGLHWIIAALIIVGDIAGGSLIALPTAIEQLGARVGFFVSLLIMVMAVLSAIFLGEAWRILLRQWPEYKHGFIRKPYAEIAYRALGPYAKTLASVSVNLSQFGIVIVFMILASKNIRDFLSIHFDGVFHLCVWILIISLLVTPMTMLKSPEDFWFLIVASGATTFCAVILIIVGSFIDFPVCHAENEHAPFRLINLFIGGVRRNDFYLFF